MKLLIIEQCIRGLNAERGLGRLGAVSISRCLMGVLVIGITPLQESIQVNHLISGKERFCQSHGCTSIRWSQSGSYFALNSVGRRGVHKAGEGGGTLQRARERKKLMLQMTIRQSQELPSCPKTLPNAALCPNASGLKLGHKGTQISPAVKTKMLTVLTS